MHTHTLRLSHFAFAFLTIVEQCGNGCVLVDRRGVAFASGGVEGSHALRTHVMDLLVVIERSGATRLERTVQWPRLGPSRGNQQFLVGEAMRMRAAF